MSLGTETIDVATLLRFDKPVPRYTSYPTAPEWHDLDPQAYAIQLEHLNTEARSLSLYFHIPFCKTMCLFCGCSVILNRRPENEQRYVTYLEKEIDLVSSKLRKDHQVTQLHFGGGTPTKLSSDLLQHLIIHIQKRFTFSPDAEISIEIDPRTVVEDQGAKLRLLRILGFNRVSFGVQDTNPQVQEAVRRRQSYAMTLQTYDLARQTGFKGVNIDLIYGLPYQTQESFQDTIEKIINMRPDRIAMFSYAKVPWLKEHQKAIPDHTLPSVEEKFAIYVQARQQLLNAGYLGLGMDHFALREDPLSIAFLQQKLHRNFQGYTLNLAEDMLGFGVTSIGYCRDAYIQNIKDLEQYYLALDAGQLPVHRGKVLSEEDQLRRWVINKLMCQFEMDRNAFEQKYGIEFDKYFAPEQASVQHAVAEGLLIDTGPSLSLHRRDGCLFAMLLLCLMGTCKEKSVLGNSPKVYSVLGFFRIFFHHRDTEEDLRQRDRF